MHRPILLGYNNIYIQLRQYETTTQILLDENTPIAYQCTRSYICMDVFTLFVDDHSITLDDIYMEFCRVS